MWDDAQRYREMGLSILPIRDGTKEPAISWKPLTERHPTEYEIQRWFVETRNGIAIVCGQISRVVALDADCRETTEFIWNNLPRTPMMTRSSPGKGHMYYRIQEGQQVPTRIKVDGMRLDIKAESSYCLAAHSIHPDTGEPYQRIGSWKLEDVPYFDPKWISTEKRSVTRESVGRLRSYLAKVESIQGTNGSAGLVRAAAICRDKGLSEAEAMIELLWWNQLPVVNPAWSERELARAVTRTYARRTKCG